MLTVQLPSQSAAEQLHTISSPTLISVVSDAIVSLGVISQTEPLLHQACQKKKKAVQGKSKKAPSFCLLFFGLEKLWAKDQRHPGVPQKLLVLDFGGSSCCFF